jgi:hypothetical protein
MVTLAALLEALNASKNRMLLIAQAALPESQFRAFRQIFLNEFGKSGLERELERLFAEDRSKDRHG